ncbi:PREDICTED: GSK-3-binding protein FRAT2 [Ceratotherium simum simum]|uniref:GSK-3-binding protein FRAT2 n=1 Tax=Ceratotherium simum simum TaxID=73337 RepID=A0ABM0HJC2_CERSS|nr:PREDICTED: GSK-3-binding protein FRAT2 [Ceratotherium simum simum]
MPCRREEEEEAGEEAEGEEEEEDDDSFLLLEQSVTLGGSGEVDRLVAQIGETLQLDAAQDSPASPCAPPGPPLQLAAGPSALPGPCRRGWLRGAVASRRLQQRRWPPAGARARDDDPHRLLQQLVLSGNLIKEAVRRLQRAVAAVAATGPAGAPGAGGGRSGPDPVALQPSGTLH